MAGKLRLKSNDAGRAEPLRLRFSKGVIERLPLPEAGRVFYYDATTAGLCVAVTSAGGKTFYRYGRIDGRPVRYRIGAFPETSVENARKVAAKLSGQIADGKNPQRQKQERRGELTLGELVAAYLDNHVRPKRKPVTAAEYQRMADKFLTPWNSRPLSAIKRSDVAALHLRIGEENGRYAANRLVALLRACFSYAIDQQTFDKANPASGIEKFSETKRDRFLQGDELPRFFAAVDTEPDPTLRDFFLLALFTGARRSNVQAMRWEEISWPRAEWRIPSTKSGDVVVVPLMGPAVEILERRRNEADGTPWVFPSYGKSGHITEPKAAWKKLLERAGIADLRIHDLRRSQGSWMAITGASLPVIGKSLGHRSTAATGIYARLSTDPVREAMEKATAAMLATGKPNLETK